MQPFLMFIPPTFSYTANNPNKTSGTTPVTKQFVVPISGDSGLQTIQLEPHSFESQELGRELQRRMRRAGPAPERFAGISGREQSALRRSDFVHDDAF